ncbi:MAG TPA: hypothetical protein VKQ27_19740 [Acetobacteraceae bacterium]|nr:hypothetical protein [Acetobacteraceae bacterium]
MAAMIRSHTSGSIGQASQPCCHKVMVFHGLAIGQDRSTPRPRHRSMYLSGDAETAIAVGVSHGKPVVLEV